MGKLELYYNDIKDQSLYEIVVWLKEHTISYNFTEKFKRSYLDDPTNIFPPKIQYNALQMDMKDSSLNPQIVDYSFNGAPITRPRPDDWIEPIIMNIIGSDSELTHFKMRWL